MLFSNCSISYVVTFLRFKGAATLFTSTQLLGMLHPWSRGQTGLKGPAC